MLEEVVAVPADLDALPGLRVKRKEVVDNSSVIPGTVIGGLGGCLLCLRSVIVSEPHLESCPILELSVCGLSYLCMRP